MTKDKGFIQLPLLLLILTGVVIVGSGSYFIAKETRKVPAENHDQQTSVQPQQNTSGTAEQISNGSFSAASEPVAQTQTQPLQQGQMSQSQQQAQPTQTQVSNTQQAQPIQTPTQTTPTPQPSQSSQNQTPTPVEILITLGTQDVDETTARIEWTTSEQTESELYLSGGDLSSQQHDSQNGYTTTHAVMLSNLQPTTDYSFQITATGNSGFADYTSSFKTKTPTPTLQMTGGGNVSLGASGNKISWVTTYASSCTASGDWSGEKSVAGEYIPSFTNAGSYTYNLACVGNNSENISKSVSVNVIDTKPKITFSFNGNATNTYAASVGSSVRMSWQFSYATVCAASGDWSGDKYTGNGWDMTFNSQGGFYYTLTCTGTNGESGSNTATVTVTQ